jgi:trehalose-phosphatase
MDAIENIADIIAAHHGHRLLAVMGFDGVLVEYDADPGNVRLSSERRALLSTFGERADVALAIVSGRRVNELRQCVSLGLHVFYIGLHGLEIEGRDISRVERQAFDTCRGPVHDIVTILGASLSSVAGVRVEDKEVAVAVHTREAGPGDAVWARVHLLSTAARVARHDELRILRGNHVLELLPNIDRPRTTAIAELGEYLEIRENRPVFTLYVGDDVPDDDAFNAIPGAGISVAVGERAPKARFHLTSPADVWRLVERLAVARMREGCP